MQRLRALRDEWFHEKVDDLTITGTFVAIFNLLFSYVPFLLILAVVGPGWVDGGYFYIDQIIILAGTLLASFYLQSRLNYGIFPKWDYWAKFCAFPLFVVLRVVGYCVARVWAVLEVIIVSIVSFVLKLAGVATVIFICIGIFGVLLFGFKQVF